MWGQRLCLNIFGKTEIQPEELLRKYKVAGFDGFFASWSGVNSLNWLAKIAEDEGMLFQSIHAPFVRSADMWKADSGKGDEALEELLLCLEDCRKLRVPIMVVHAYIGFEEKNPDPPQIGLMRFEKLVLEAEKANVKIAFENTEGEEYLDALMRYFAHSPNVGFCWDTGHEMCYNHSRDLLADYGDRLIATHINDNLGISDFDGKTTFIDDLHLLPMDGVADWEDIARRLNACGYEGVLTFELSMWSKPGRHDNDLYRKMGIDEYLAEAYKRACRVAVLKNKEQRK